jgi:hypothetical protein
MVPVMFAAAQKQQDQKLLAELIGKDKEDKYEFKILRGYLGAFRKAERLQAILEEERRSRRAQAYDAMSGSEIDPYRTQIGSSLSRSVLFVSLGLLVAGGLAFFLLAGANNPEIAAGSTRWPTVVVAIVVGLVLMLALAIKRNR